VRLVPLAQVRLVPLAQVRLVPLAQVRLVQVFLPHFSEVQDEWQSCALRPAWGMV
jgi:hypothetical protein